MTQSLSQSAFRFQFSKDVALSIPLVRESFSSIVFLVVIFFGCIDGAIFVGTREVERIDFVIKDFMLYFKPSHISELESDDGRHYSQQIQQDLARHT
jgi:hypothetical protein